MDPRLKRILIRLVIALALATSLQATPADPGSNTYGTFKQTVKSMIKHAEGSPLTNVLFIADSSSSISDSEFDRSMLFCNKLTTRLGSKAKAALTLFASNAKHITNGFEQSLPLAVNRIAGSTNLAGVFPLAVTHHQVRVDANTILIVMTDGQADDVKAAVEQLEKYDHLFVQRLIIGFGSVSEKDLKQLAGAKGQIIKAADTSQLIDFLDTTIADANPIVLSLYDIVGHFVDNAYSELSISFDITNMDETRSTTADLGLYFSDPNNSPSAEKSFIRHNRPLKLTALRPGETKHFKVKLKVRSFKVDDLKFKDIPCSIAIAARDKASKQRYVLEYQELKTPISIFASYFRSFKFANELLKNIVLIGPARNGKTTLIMEFMMSMGTIEQSIRPVCAGDFNSTSCTIRSELLNTQTPAFLGDTFGIEEQHLDTIWASQFFECVLDGCCYNVTLADLVQESLTAGQHPAAALNCNRAAAIPPRAIIFISKVTRDSGARVLAKLGELERMAQLRNIPIVLGLTFLNTLSSIQDDDLAFQRDQQLKATGMSIGSRHVHYLFNDKNSSCETQKHVLGMMYDLFSQMQSQDQYIPPNPDKSSPLAWLVTLLVLVVPLLLFQSRKPAQAAPTNASVPPNLAPQTVVAPAEEPTLVPPEQPIVSPSADNHPAHPQQAIHAPTNAPPVVPAAPAVAPAVAPPVVSGGPPAEMSAAVPSVQPSFVLAVPVQAQVDSHVQVTKGALEPSAQEQGSSTGLFVANTLQSPQLAIIPPAQPQTASVIANSAPQAMRTSVPDAPSTNPFADSSLSETPASAVPSPCDTSPVEEEQQPSS